MGGTLKEMPEMKGATIEIRGTKYKIIGAEWRGGFFGTDRSHKIIHVEIIEVRNGT